MAYVQPIFGGTGFPACRRLTAWKGGATSQKNLWVKDTLYRFLIEMHQISKIIY
jgi:hypothetical protein